jgi:hypothetical protein
MQLELQGAQAGAQLLHIFALAAVGLLSCPQLPACAQLGCCCTAGCAQAATSFPWDLPWHGHAL